MNLPPYFDLNTAKEVSCLIKGMYTKYEAYRADKPFILPPTYAIVEELWAKPGGLFSHPEFFGAILLNQITQRYFIIFRGTDSFDDWFSDADVTQIASPLPGLGGKVAEGFLKIYQQFEPKIRAFADTTPTDFDIVAGGHSLGGAFVPLADDHFTSAYSFSAPRVGDPVFASYLKNRHYFRIFNTEDIVPAGPLAVLGDILFEHAGIPVAFTDNTGSIEGNHAMATADKFLESLNA